MDKRTNIIIGGMLVVLGIILGTFGTILSDNFIKEDVGQSTTTQPTNTREEEVDDYLKEIIREFSYYYVDEDHLTEGALIGMVDSLDDPYSTFFTEQGYEDYNNYMNEVMYGVGVNVVMNGSYPIIVNVIDGSPAQRAGFMAGQSIKTVDGVDVANKTVDEIASLIKGPQGTERIIGVYTDDTNVVHDIHVATDMVTTPSIDYNFDRKNNIGYGYLRIDGFMGPTYEEMVAAMSHLESQDMDTLIIDVRDNPGGYLTSVTHILDYFLNTEEPFMYAKSRLGEETQYYIKENDHTIQYDIVVLLNENSASAAEVFSAAMNELGNYQLIGTASFGKGTMQSSFPLNKEKTMYAKLTTDIWLTPSKNWIHHIGVEPTMEVEQTNYIGLSYIDPFQDIAFDHVNVEIRDVQEFLSRKGYDVRTDGYFDQETKAAVLAYQFSNNIPQTGIVDDRTAYTMNIQLMDYLNNKEYDNQYQKAVEYILNN